MEFMCDPPVTGILLTPCADPTSIGPAPAAMPAATVTTQIAAISGTTIHGRSRNPCGQRVKLPRRPRWMGSCMVFPSSAAHGMPTCGPWPNATALDLSLTAPRADPVPTGSFLLSGRLPVSSAFHTCDFYAHITMKSAPDPASANKDGVRPLGCTAPISPDIHGQKTSDISLH